MYFLVNPLLPDDISGSGTIFFTFFRFFFRYFTDFDLKNRKRHVIFALGPYSHAQTPHPADARTAGEKEFGT